MSQIGTEQVKQLAELAKIKLSDAEIASLSVELGKIVGFVEQLQKTDTTKVEPTNQVTGLSDVWRPDEVKTFPDRAALLANAPMSRDGYIKVKRVIQ